MVASVLFMAGLLAAGVDVRGSATCPSPEAVADRLRGLLGDQPATGDRVRLDRDDGGLHVALIRADGRLAGASTIAGAHGCDELADAAAVIVASWQTDPGHGAPVPVDLPGLAPVGLRAEAPSAAHPRWELGAGLGLGLAGSDVVPAALIVGRWHPGGGAFGLSAAATVTGDASTSLPDGSARWSRSMLALGPVLRRSVGRLAFEFGAGAAGALLSVNGQGFATNVSHHDLVFGGVVGARLGWTGAAPHPWLALDASGWPIRSHLYEAPSDAEAALPRLQLVLTLGLSWSG